jgi:hypothetical protein
VFKSASFAETVKSAEPISSLSLAALTRGEDSVSTSEWLTTLPIVVGVALSSYSDSSFHILGFLAAALSNFMFSMRGLNTKQLRRLHGTPHGLDDIHLFYRISRFGATLTVPLAFLFEGRALLRLVFGGGLPAPPEPSHGLPIAVTSAAANAATLMEPLTGTVVGGASQAENATHDPLNSQKTSIAFWGLVAATLLNGVCYWTYNQTSFVVLGRVSFVTHATLNVMRRVCIIVVTSLYFAIPMSPTNVIGIILAISGFALFLYIKVHGANLPLPR